MHPLFYVLSRRCQLGYVVVTRSWFGEALSESFGPWLIVTRAPAETGPGDEAPRSQLESYLFIECCLCLVRQWDYGSKHRSRQ